MNQTGARYQQGFWFLDVCKVLAAHCNPFTFSVAQGPGKPWSMASVPHQHHERTRSLIDGPLGDIPGETSYDVSFPRYRINTGASNISQMESSWEDIHPGSVPPLTKSRASSRGSGTSKKSNGFIKLKLPHFFRMHSKSPAKEEKIEHVVVIKSLENSGQSEADGNILKQMEDDDEFGGQKTPPQSLKKKSQIQRMRLTASESEPKSRRSSPLTRGRSSSIVGNTTATKTAPSPASSYRDIPGPKRSRKLMSHRSIGIVGGEEFIINPTNGDKFVNYIHTAWNNVKYGWAVKPKVNLTLRSPIWILGHCYTMDSERSLMYDLFLKDFKSRLWFTYRREFPALAGSSLTSDCGWGCMLRSGQMMLAQALVTHFLGRAWRWNDSDQIRETDVFHRQIIRWCGDTSYHDQLFGLHKLVAVGQKCGKRAGDWYGPGSLAHILQKAMFMARNANPLLRDISIYVSQDCTIYNGDIAEMRKKQQCCNPGDQSALLVLVSVRLGSSRVNPLYIPCVKDLMTVKYSVGVIGGRPKHSLYFIGWQDNYLVNLDPHFCQETVDVAKRSFTLSSFHCSAPRKLNMEKMDPSCTLGFYCRNVAEYEDFVNVVTEIQSRHCREYPIFTFSDGMLADYEKEGLDLTAFEAEFHPYSTNYDRSVSKSDENGLMQNDNDFVVL